MTRQPFFILVQRVRRLSSHVQLLLRHQIIEALILALLLSFFPWSTPDLSLMAESAFQGAPESVQWAKPLALSITGWADEALTALQPISVFAGANITLVLSKRDDGPSLGAVSPGPDPVAVGGVLAYYIHVTNTGSITATVFLTDNLPSEVRCLGAGITSQSGGADWFSGCSSDKTRVLFFTSDAYGLGGNGLGPGKASVVYIQVQVQNGLQDGQVFTNTSSSYTAHAAQEPGFVYVGTNNVTTTVRAPGLKASKTVTPSLVAVGGLLTYTIRYTNTGSVDASNIVITDTLDPNVTFDSATPPVTPVGQILVWDIGSLAVNASETITVRVKASEAVPNNTILSNTAEISCNEGVLTNTGVITALVKTLSIQVSKTPSPVQVRAGERVTYTIRLTNTSEVPINAIRVTDTLPAGFASVVSESSDFSFIGAVGQNYVWESGEIPAGSWRVITLSANVITFPVDVGGTSVTNRITATHPLATLSSDQKVVTIISNQPDTVTVAIDPSTNEVGDQASITVTVRDQYGNLLHNSYGSSINLSANPPGATLGSSSLTLANGQATTFISSTVATVYTVTAQVAATSIQNTAQVTFTPSVLHHFSISPIASPQRAGVDFTVVITAQDKNNNTMTGFNEQIALQDNISPNTLQPAWSGNFVNGVLTGQVISITLVRANQPILVGTGVTATASNPFTVIAGQPATISVQASAPTVPLGQVAIFTATVTDAWGNLVAGEKLTFTVNAGTATPGTGTTNSAGITTTQVQSTTTPGVVTLVVSATNGVTGTGSVEFVPGCPTTMLMTVAPSSLNVGESAVITVEVVDQWNNPVNWGTVNLLTNDSLGSGSITPSSLSLASGGGTVTATVSSTVVGVKTITATTAAQAGCASISNQGAVTFVVGAAANVNLAMAPNPQRVGVNATLYATVTDQYNNPIAGQVVTFAVAPGGLGSGSISPSTGTTDAQGGASTTILSTLVGQTTVTATVASATNVSRSLAVSFTADLPQNITITVSPDHVVGGENAMLTVTMTDQYGNACGGYTVTFTTDPLAQGGVSPNPATADVNGVATAWISATLPGVIVITGTAVSGVRDTTLLTITNGPLASFRTSPVLDTVAGVNFTLYITAVDAWGNTRTQDNLNVSLTDLSGTLLPMPAVATLVNGTGSIVLAVTRAMVNDQIGVSYLSIVTQTNAFTVTAAAPYTIGLEYMAVLSTCTPSPITAIVSDTYGNPVPGQLVTFIHSGVGQILPATATTFGDGRAMTMISSTLLGPATVQAQVAGVTPATAYVTFLIGPPVVNIVAASPEIVAGNSTVFTVTVTDCGGNPLANILIGSAVMAGPGWVVPNAGQTDSGGIITFTFASTKTGQALVEAGTADNSSIGAITITVRAADPVRIALTATPNPMLPEGAQSDLMALVFDQYDNLVGDGIQVRFMLAAPPGSFLTPASGTPISTTGGYATSTLTSGVEQGIASIRAELVSNPGISATVDVSIRWFIGYLPIVMRNYPTGDLQVTSIEAIHKGKSGGQDMYEVRVTVRNNGPQTAVRGYWVDLYLNPKSPVALNVLWHSVSTRGQAWYISRDLAPGEQMVLSTADPLDPQAPSGHYSYWPGDLGGNNEPVLWAMVDCWGTAPNGARLEMNEDNNIFGPVSVPVP